MKHGKKYIDSAKTIESAKLYEVDEAVSLVLDTAKAKLIILPFGSISLTIWNIGIEFAIFGLRQVFLILLISLVTGVASSIMPIIKISKEKPVDLIRRP